MRRAKITIVGAGNVGAGCALWAAKADLGDIVLMDIPELESRTRGRALDLAQCGPIERFDCNIVGTSNWDDTADSNVVIVTAGMPRKPGMSRDDLIEINTKIVGQVCEQIKRLSPDCILIIVSNPLDAMTYAAWKKTNFPTNRVIGQAGCLDISRYKTFISMELGCSIKDINALLMGGHGADMVPLPRYTSVSGIPVTQLIRKERLDSIVERTRQGGTEIVELMGTGAYWAPASAIIQMTESIVKNKKRILPCSAFCEKQYGVGGYYVGVPCMLGSAGVEKIYEVDLNDDERELFTKSANHVKELSEKVMGILEA